MGRIALFWAFFALLLSIPGDGCAGLGGARALAPWVIAGSSSLLFLFARRIRAR